MNEENEMIIKQRRCYLRKVLIGEIEEQNNGGFVMCCFLERIEQFQTGVVFCLWLAVC